MKSAGDARVSEGVVGLLLCWRDCIVGIRVSFDGEDTRVSWRTCSRARMYFVVV